MGGVLDHIIIATTALESGARAVESALGVPLQAGGQHAAMGTYNRLLSLGEADYLEVIAIDPDGTKPGQNRWFNLDQFSGPTRLTHWALRVEDLDAALAQAPAGSGEIWELSRDNLKWRIAIPGSGQTPCGGLFPMLLQWESAHPAGQLADQGVRLERLELASPEAEALSDALAPLMSEARVHIRMAERAEIRATFTTPAGPKTLGDAP